MAIFVFEPDIIVQSDIAETLAAAFADRTVELFDSLPDLLERLGAAIGPIVSIVSSGEEGSIAAINSFSTGQTGLSFVLLGEPAQSGEAPAFDHVQVPLPFNTAMLIWAVRNAISGRR
jgi:hypothetical protein